MRILILEDDPENESAIIDAIRKEFSHESVEFLGFQTESDFRNSLENGGIEAWRPDLAILDMMVRWMKVSKNLDVSKLSLPEDVAEQGFFLAGMRCEALLRKKAMLRNLPVIFYSILDREKDFGDIPPPRTSSTLWYLEKTQVLNNLTQQIGKMLNVKPASA